jgi:hypothetical protein
MRLRNALALSVAIFGLGFTASPARSETPEQIDQLIMDAVYSTALSAVEHATAMVNDEPIDTALATLDTAVGQAVVAAAAAATEESQGLLGKKGPSVLAKIAAFQAKLAKAHTYLSEGIESPYKVNKAIGKAATTGLKAVAAIRKKFPVQGIGLMETNAKTAGFHGAGDPVDFKTIAGLDALGEPCTVEPQITATGNPPGALADPGVFADGMFRVTLGTERGVVTVQATACGVTRTWLLYNYGDKEELKNIPVDLGGTWSGSYTTTGPAFCAGIPGSWTATFSVDEFGNISGDYSADGFGGTISGRVEGGSLNFTVTGQGDASLTGTVSGNRVSGSFTSSQECPVGGAIRGTFQGSRTS